MSDNKYSRGQIVKFNVDGRLRTGDIQSIAKGVLKVRAFDTSTSKLKSYAVDTAKHYVDLA